MRKRGRACSTIRCPSRSSGGQAEELSLAEDRVFGAADHREHLATILCVINYILFVSATWFAAGLFEQNPKSFPPAMGAGPRQAGNRGLSISGANRGKISLKTLKPRFFWRGPPEGAAPPQVVVR